MNELQIELKKAFQNQGLSPDLAIIVSSDLPELCDYQCNGALSGAKILKSSPLKIAESVLNSISEEIKAKYELTVVKPGFINIKLKSQALLEKLKDNLAVTKENKKVLIDYGSPNVAKGMHVGHVRSTLIGSALVSIHKYAGHEVVGDNHLGDWGTPLGVVITKIKEALNEGFNWSLAEIESLYVKGAAQYKDNVNVKFKEDVLLNTKLLQKGDAEVRALWQKIVDITIDSLKKDYSRLGVSFDLWHGESYYENLLPQMVQELKSKGMTSVSTRPESLGVLVVNLHENQPFLVAKSDGSYLYSTSDLACLKERAPKFDQILYVVDKRQAMHFELLFEAAQTVGYLESQDKVEHIAFGTINGLDGKPFKTRDGEVLKLNELIDQVFSAAEAKIKSTFTQEDKEKNLPTIAVGALKFAELKHSRTSDYVFDLEKFMSLQGFTGPSVMYSGVRAKSILAKSKEVPVLTNAIFSDSERDLVFTLGQFKEVFKKTLELNEPHQLCKYAYAVANDFNRFYDQNPILPEKNLVKHKHYLALTEKVLDTLTTTLSLLGIQIPEKM